MTPPSKPPPSCNTSDVTQTQADIIRRISYSGIALPIIYLIMAMLIYPSDLAPGDFATETLSQKVVAVFFIVPPLGLMGLVAACAACVLLIETILRVAYWFYIRYQSRKPLDEIDIMFGEELISRNSESETDIRQSKPYESE
ncbi:MAG TPA: hypothetical protein DCM28_07585 [Phycisphaerales bacterium]|nr:hypothetical protein [Phycisphaerales bacterium]HCD33220.1 hypothetical protein [Phycisphaerales bacterium]